MHEAGCRLGDIGETVQQRAEAIAEALMIEVEIADPDLVLPILWLL
ncbi:hypothetical protein HM1_2649 [Heliomicrobium modesticaldum Ice1]|uniref:Uncharacterized protein n=1 Tax=Heliobacterium modesticaldum (strain ATCC 51547 / Ice1) TaxID=498761 RepID=B0TBG5_HELMI|nr:hypothetical protein [Heliomicrobium modesticaldum]ABZ85178.1 hypothetical protein HM1_2649 [Heliomicrobium modesticaldum Ice1]